MNRAIIVFLILCFGFVAGFNAARKYYYYENVWPEERNGLLNLNNMAKNDKSARLGLILMTEKNQYQVSALNNQFELRAGIFQK